MPCGEPTRSGLRKQPDMSTACGTLHRRSPCRPSRSLWRRHDLRHSGRSQRGNVPCPAALAASRHVLVRHEQGAGFMADGYARATGKPGVCFTITGPGLTNILTPLGQAWSDSSNVLVISSALDIKDSAQGRGRLHEMIDQRGAAAAVTSLHMRAYTPKDVRDAVARAFADFASQRPRPAYLEIPLDLLKEPAGEGWVARGLARHPLSPAGRRSTRPWRSSTARSGRSSSWAAGRCMRAGRPSPLPKSSRRRSSPRPRARVPFRPITRSASAM